MPKFHLTNKAVEDLSDIWEYTYAESNLLGYLANRHIIFYKTISKTEIEVIRILHSSMDLKSRIAE